MSLFLLTAFWVALSDGDVEPKPLAPIEDMEQDRTLAAARQGDAEATEQSGDEGSTGPLPHIAGPAGSVPYPTQAAGETEADPWTGWYRPVDDPVFNTSMGNNHDAILFVEPGAEHPYHMIVSHTGRSAHLWRTNTFSWSSDDWELVSDQYIIAPRYEFDDGVVVNGTYYIYESGTVYTFTGDLAQGSGRWVPSGSFPKDEVDDVGVLYENGTFHLFGEHGDYPYGHDGSSIAHYTSTTGLGDWLLVDAKAADANPEGGAEVGVGDATVVKIDDHYYMFSDRETQTVPYHVVAWRTDDLHVPFEFLGTVLTPRWNETGHWDNHRIQDADIVFVPELNRFVMVANLMDKDGDPGGDFPTMAPPATRVIGMFYSTAEWRPDDGAVLS